MAREARMPEDVWKMTPLGLIGKTIDRGIAAGERGLVKAADWGEGTAIGAIASAAIPAAVGIRAINANITSGHGSQFTPVVRDERYFPQAALRNLAQNLDEHGGKGTSRFASTGVDSMGAVVASQAVGGSTARDGKLTDAFDVNHAYPIIDELKEVNKPLGTVAQVANDVVAGIFGSDLDRDEGKVRTEIPLSALDRYRTRQAAKAGDAGRSPSSGVPRGHNAALDGYSGPRIVVNPSTFRNEKDGLCVAFDEAFRILMEVNGFDPVAEPTERQRKFFAETAYANDERMLRRTILARICTFDTSVSDPTDEQLEEAVEFLETVMEIGAPQNEREQRAVQRIRDAVAASVGRPRAEGTPEPPAEGPAVAAAGGGDSRLVRADIDPREDEENMYVSEGQEEQRIADEATGGSVQPAPDTAQQKDQSAFANGKGPAEITDKDVEDFKSSGETPKQGEQAASGRTDAAGRQLDDHGRVMAGETPKQREQAASGRTDAAGRQLDDHGRVMAGEKPRGRTPTAGEQAAAARKAASTEAYLQRKAAREERRAANNADRVADRDELIEKAQNGTFGDEESTANALLGNSTFQAPWMANLEKRARFRKRYGI